MNRQVENLSTHVRHVALRRRLRLMLFTGFVFAVVGSSMYWFPAMVGLNRDGPTSFYGRLSALGAILQLIGTSSFAFAFTIALSYADSMKRKKIQRHFVGAGIGFAIGLFGLFAAAMRTAYP